MAKKSNNNALMATIMKSDMYSSATLTPQNESKYKDIHFMPISVYQMIDAPKDWNRYPRIKDISIEKYLELKASIAANGVLDYLILWDQGNGQYMIIAGHNRKDICVELCEDYPDSKDKYEKPICYVYGPNELDENKARILIQDTNIHRPENLIPKRTLMEILDDRIELTMQNKTPKGEDVITLAEKMGIKSSKLYELLKIRQSLLQPLKELYFDSKVAEKQAVLLASLEGEEQRYIIDNYLADVNTAAVKRLNPEVFKKTLSWEIRKEMIDSSFAFKEPEKREKKITITIPKKYEDELMKKIQEWISELENR